MNKANYYKKTASYLAVLGNPVRIRILTEIGSGEVCVCHLEAVLKKRQAYISQHLMALRDQGILETRKEGKYVFYRISDLQMLTFIKEAGLLAGVDKIDIPDMQQPPHAENCACPHCTDALIEKGREEKWLK